MHSFIYTNQTLSSIDIQKISKGNFPYLLLFCSALRRLVIYADVINI